MPTDAPDGWLTSVKKFLSNPITGIVVGLAGGWFFWWISVADVKPVFKVSPVEVVAQKASPRLTMQWDQTPIERLCVCRVAVWNDGRGSLTQDKLPPSDPVRIVASSPVKILDVTTTNVSRPNLKFDLEVKDGKSGSVVVFRPAQGDALEGGDGGAFRLLFTGDCATSFTVKGRVVGSTTGFGLGPATEWWRQVETWFSLLGGAIAGFLVGSGKLSFRTYLLYLSIFLLLSYLLGKLNSTPSWVPF